MNSKPQTATVVHYSIRTVILLGISVYIAYLVETNSLQLYIGERIRPLVGASALFMYALAVIQGFLAYRTYKGSVVECDCCSTPPAKSWPRASLLYGLIALPLLLGFLLPDTVLGGSFASKKGIILSAVAPAYGGGPAQPAQPAQPAVAMDDAADSTESTEAGEAGDGLMNNETTTPSPPTEEDLDQLFVAEDDFSRDLAELAKRLYVLPMIEVRPDIYMEVLSSIVTFKEAFMGKEIEINGFIYRESGLAEHQFVIGRIAVQCCTADATPYGVLAEYEGAPELEDETWVKLKGTLGQTEYNGNVIIKIDVSESSVIEAPDNPYIYPNFDFLNASVD
ncbi:TIGR03943 family putative permease subunit [Paenibacillus sanguinis]|uniref:TIGR03943 family putative permease subunit n=1 Tax=Paenibacillus sanguinis TaxID=225906 RepID=UPI00036818FD|nr:TIGR03943 family protein [Paenibacillus sanguinis]